MKIKVRKDLMKAGQEENFEVFRRHVKHMTKIFTLLF